jgi:uncharacterized protein (UPF0332 family)
MKLETAAFLRKAWEFLAKARDELDVLHYNDEAGRAAYLAGLHVAQALIFVMPTPFLARGGIAR